MAAIFRIAVILGIVYMARFILAHEHQTQSEVDEIYAFHAQVGESSNALEDSNEELLIEPNIPLHSRTRYNSKWHDDPDIKESYENAPIESGVPVSGRTIQNADEFEKDLIEESMEQTSSNEKLTIHRRMTTQHEAWSEKDRNGESIDDTPSKEKVSTQYRGYVSEENNFVKLNKENPSKEKELLESGEPLRGRTISHTARSEENKIVKSNKYSPSNEKVLIDSAVPLRGRTIHHTAWSEEDEIVESVVETPPENDNKRVYDSWSLTKAFNYILSFIYDVEEEGAIVQTLPEDADETLKSQNKEFYEMLLLQTQNILEKPKEMDGNASNYNQNKDKFRGTSQNSDKAYVSKQNTKWLESWDGDFKNGDEFIDFPYEDEESLYEDNDFEYEDDFSQDYFEERHVGVEQRSPQKDTDLKTSKNNVSDIKNTGESEYMVTVEVEDNEYVQTTQSSKVNELKKHDSVPKSSKLDEFRNGEIQENENEAVSDHPLNNYEKSTTEEHSKVNAKPSIDTNKRLKGEPIKEIKDILHHLEKRNGENLSMVKEYYTSKINGNDAESKEKTLKYPAELESHNVSKNSEKNSPEIPYDKLKESLNRPVSEDIKNESKTAVNSDAKNSVTNMTSKNVASTSNTHQRHSEMRKENAPGTKHKFNIKSPTVVPKPLPQHKEKTSKFNTKVENLKTVTPVSAKDNRENKHKVNSMQRTDFKNEAQNPNYRTGTVASDVNTEQLESQLNKKKDTGELPNARAQGSKKQNKENDTKHSKPKIKELSDMYPDFEAIENVASYNYILDSDEFIRIDENDSKKINKKQNNYSASVKSQRNGDPTKPTHISSGPTTSLKDKNEDGVFETILEYLYKYTNSSYLLALREHNSTES